MIRHQDIEDLLSAATAPGHRAAAAPVSATAHPMVGGGNSGQAPNHPFRPGLDALPIVILLALLIAALVAVAKVRHIRAFARRAAA